MTLDERQTYKNIKALNNLFATINKKFERDVNWENVVDIHEDKIDMGNKFQFGSNSVYETFINLNIDEQTVCLTPKKTLDATELSVMVTCDGKNIGVLKCKNIQREEQIWSIDDFQDLKGMLAKIIKYDKNNKKLIICDKNVDDEDEYFPCQVSYISYLQKLRKSYKVL